MSGSGLWTTTAMPNAEPLVCSSLGSHRTASPAASGIPWPVLSAIGLAVPMLREVVGVRHQFDQPFVLDAAETTATFGLTATPWDEVVRATVAGAAPSV